jgi:hypothetical protein
MDFLTLVAIPALGVWMMEKIMDELLRRWQRRRPLDAQRWRRIKRQFHFWSAAALSGWFVLVGVLLADGAWADGVVTTGEAALLATFVAGAAIMAIVARIRRRRLQ